MNSDNLKLNQLSEQIIGAAIEVHRHLGPGLLESAYQKALAYELSTLNLCFETEKEINAVYKGINIGKGFRLDFLVENAIIVELKSVEDLNPIHSAQLLSYLKLTKIKLGLLVNFNTELLKMGIKRLIN